MLKSTQDANKLRQVRFLEQQEAILFETPALGIARTAIPERPSGIGGLDIAGRQLDKPQRTADLDALSARLQIEDFVRNQGGEGRFPTKESVLPRAQAQLQQAKARTPSLEQFFAEDATGEALARLSRPEVQAARKQAQRTISAFKESYYAPVQPGNLIPEDLAADIMEFRQFSAIAPSWLQNVLA